MKNFIELGESITATATAAVTAGVPVLIEGMVLVPKQDAAIGESFAAMDRGAFQVKKQPGLQVKQFEPAYFDVQLGEMTTEQQDNLVGVFLDATITDEEIDSDLGIVLFTGIIQVAAPVSTPAKPPPPPKRASGKK